MISEEEAVTILKEATDTETMAAVSLTFLIYYLLQKNMPNENEISIRQKALSIEAVQAISEIKRES